LTGERLEDAFLLQSRFNQRNHLTILKVQSFLRNNKMAEKNYYQILGIEKTDDHELIA